LKKTKSKKGGALILTLKVCAVKYRDQQIQQENSPLPLLWYRVEVNKRIIGK